MIIGSVKSLHDLIIVTTIIAGLVCLAFYVRAIQLRKAGVPLLPAWWMSPGFHLFHRDRFTERGLRWRKALFIAGAIFILLFIVDFFVL
jgi:hypothetical protein